MLSREEASQVVSKFDNWLKQTQLSQQLEIIKLRRGPNPDPDAQIDHELTMLELRFITNLSDEDLALAAFDSFLGRFQANNKVALPGRLFYKFIHLSGLPRSGAALHVHVLGQDHAVYLSPTNHSIVLQLEGTRAVRKEKFVHNTNVGTNALTKIVPNNNSSRAVAEDIKSFLAACLPPGKPGSAALSCEAEEDYVNVRVKGVKNLVLTSKNLWENVQISIEIKNPSPEITKLVCYLDGQFASVRAPEEDDYSDMDPKYRVQLEDYAADLLEKLRKHLEDSNR